MFKSNTTFLQKESASGFEVTSTILDMANELKPKKIKYLLIKSPGVSIMWILSVWFGNAENEISSHRTKSEENEI